MKISLACIICVIFAILNGVTEANEDECTYVFVHKPVCGNDGRTYINAGHLTCEKLKRPGLLLLREGECPPGGSIIEDGPLGDRGDDSGGAKKVKITLVKKGHKKKGIKDAITKQIVKSLIKAEKRSHKKAAKRRGRRSAEENYDFQEHSEEYPEYEYLDDALAGEAEASDSNN